MDWKGQEDFGGSEPEVKNNVESLIRYQIDDPESYESISWHIRNIPESERKPVSGSKRAAAHGVQHTWRARNKYGGKEKHVEVFFLDEQGLVFSRKDLGELLRPLMNDR